MPEKQEPDQHPPITNGDRLVIVINRLLQAAAQIAPWVAGVFIARAAADAVGALTGQRTLADIQLYLGVVGELGNPSVPWLLLAAMATLWKLERSEKLRKVETLQARIRKLESREVETRLSSGLTARGETDPRDR